METLLVWINMSLTFQSFREKTSILKNANRYTNNGLYLLGIHNINTASLVVELISHIFWEVEDRGLMCRFSRLFSYYTRVLNNLTRYDYNIILII